MGVVPQALLVLVISFAYLEGEVAGPIVGFTSGLLLDLLLPGSVLGLSALLYTLVGYGAARFGAQGPGDQLVTPVVAVLVGSVVAEAGYAILSVGLGRPWVSLGQTVRIVLLVVIYNTLLAAILFPLVRRIALYVRPQRVVKI
jgi:rod shape-determining protein MreD